MLNDFSVMAPYYERLMSGVSAEWAAKVVREVGRFAPNPRGADAGCGTGSVTRALASAGFSVVGFDPSAGMLNEAAALGGAEYVLGGLKEVGRLRNLGFVTAVNDVINYIRPQNLVKNFAAVYAALDKKGVFLFDVSSEYKLRSVLGENLFGEDGEDFSYMWFNTQKKDGVLMELVYFLKEGDKYRREEESFFEYAHKAEDVAAALKTAGFSRVSVSGRKKRPAPDDERLYFRAFK